MACCRTYLITVLLLVFPLMSFADPQSAMCDAILRTLRASSQEDPVFETRGIELLPLNDRPSSEAISAILRILSAASLNPNINRIPLIASGPLDFIDHGTVRAHMVPGLGNSTEFTELVSWTLELAKQIRLLLSAEKNIRLVAEAELRFPTASEKKVTAPAFAVALVPLIGYAGLLVNDQRVKLHEDHGLLLSGTDVKRVYPEIKPVTYQLVEPQTPLLLLLRFYTK